MGYVQSSGKGGTAGRSAGGAGTGKNRGGGSDTRSNFREFVSYRDKRNVPDNRKKYPGGELISPSLPDNYQDGRGKPTPEGLAQQCSNCYFNNKGYCSVWNAAIKESWVCNSWGAPSTNQNLIKFEKPAYGSKRVTDNIDTDFSELTQNNKKDLTIFFNLYNSLFFDIPKEGITSHEALMKRSREYLNNYIDPKDGTIEALRDEIEHLNGTLLNNSMKAGAVSNDLNQFESIDKITVPKVSLIEPDGSDLLDPNDESNWPVVGERVTPTPVGSDTNNDGIDDSKQNLSKYGTQMLFCAESGNVSSNLRNPSHWYYKPEYYGKPIYCFLRKLPYGINGTNNLIVVNLGSKGERKYRFLKSLAFGSEYRIQKKFWTDKNAWPSGKETGAAGYFLEPLT